MSLCLNNTLNASHFDTYVFSLKNPECFDNLEGVAEAVTKAALCQMFTPVPDTLKIPSMF